mmetsp:Transcript_29864/g.96810  ORF Transcript_29864/g.96810 Transcript_29864/m.96810 type:complete len:237 (-) Transcript_29864:774-1484(-)
MEFSGVSASRTTRTASSSNVPASDGPLKGCVGWSQSASARSDAVSAALRFSAKRKRAPWSAWSSSDSVRSASTGADRTVPTQAQMRSSTSSTRASPSSVRSTESSKSCASSNFAAVPQLSASTQPRSRNRACRLSSPSWPSRWDTKSSGVAPRSCSSDRAGSGHSNCSDRQSRTGTTLTTRGTSSLSAAQGVTRGALARPAPDDGMAPKRPSPATSFSSSSSDSLPTTAKRILSPT